MEKPSIVSHVKLVYDAEKGVMVPRPGAPKGEKARAARICFVDDSRTSSYVTLKILRQYGYEVEAFRTAEEALDSLMEQDYDLLLTDLLLSHGDGMNGDDLVRVLRQCGLPEKTRLPAVVITGDQGSEVGERLRRIGVDEVLFKPLKGKDLNQVLQRLLSRPESAPVLEEPVSGAETSSPRAATEPPAEISAEKAARGDDLVTQVIDGFEDFTDRPSIFSELEDPIQARRPAQPKRPNPFLDENESLLEPPAHPWPTGQQKDKGAERSEPIDPHAPSSENASPPFDSEAVASPPSSDPGSRPRVREPSGHVPESPPPADVSGDSLLSLLEDFDTPAPAQPETPPKRLRRALGIPLLLMLVALVVSASTFGLWNWWQGREPEVTLVTVMQGPIYETVHATGRVVSDRLVDVTGHVPGQLVAVLAQEGERVEKGQVLARVDDQEVKMRVNRIEATLVSLKEEVNRANKILERLRRAFQVGAVSRQALEDAEADWTTASARLTVAQEELSAAKLELERTRIKAPFAGIVTEVVAHPGQWVAPPQPILKLVDDRRKLVHLRVSATDGARLAPGQTVVLSSASFVDRRWREKVLRIVPTGEADAVQVEVSLGRNAPPLRLGQPVSGEIRIRGDEQAVKLPLAALVERNGEPAVMVLRDGKIHFRAVETGIKDATHVEIRSGLQPGDRVVLAPGRILEEGQVVRIADRG